MWHKRDRKFVLSRSNKGESEQKIINYPNDQLSQLITFH
jgi:hypothetical protein